MNNKTVIVILTVAAALTAFIFFFERGGMTTSERQERKNRVFTEYKRDRVDKLSLKHISGSEVALEKVASVSDPEGRWTIVKPKSMDADQTEVESLLSALDFLLVDRAVEGEKNVQDARFGLHTPRIQGTFSIMGKTTSFDIGADAEGEKVYFHTDQAKNTVFAVNAEILTSLDKSANDLRTKRLAADELADASKIDLKRSLGDLVLTKQGTGDWQVQVGDKKILAASDQVKELAAAVGDLSAERFIADDVKPEGLAQYGLASPAVEVSIALKKDKSLSVRLGDPCKDNPALRYATIVSSGTVACVKDELLTMVERPLLRFEETRLAPLDIEEVKSIHLTDGNKSLTVERGDAKWKMPADDMEVDDEAVTALLKAFTETRAKQIDTDPAVLSGLSKPIGTVTLTTEDNKKIVLEAFGKESDLLKMRRQGEAALLRMPSDMTSKLSADSLTVRKKTMKQGEAEQADRIEVTGQTSQTLEKKDGTWQLFAPLMAAADMTAARKLAELTAEIKAERFVAKVALKEHGFDRPFAVIKTHFAAKNDGQTDTAADKDTKPSAVVTTVLEIGNADAEGMRYARLRGKDETVFLVSDAYEYAIRKLLIARDLLQIDETAVRRLTFKTATLEKSFSKTSDDAWKPDAEGVFDADALKKIVADLGGQKAVSAESFGPEDPAFSAPTLTIVAEFQDDKTPSKTVTVGPKSKDDAENAYLARMDGLDVTFSIPARIVDDILHFLNPASAR